MANLPDFIYSMVREAGKIALSATDFKVDNKDGAGRDIVTQVDIAVERLVKKQLAAHFPDHSLLSEETKSDITCDNMPQHLWVLDPIDGTVNLRYSRNDSAISLAYAHNGEVAFGAAYNPFNGEIFFAEKGKGSFLNGKKLQVGSHTELGTALLGMDNRNKPDKMKRDLQTFISLPDSRLPQLRMCGSGVLQLCSIASQRLDLYYHPVLKPWDKAAALLVIEEAGGTVKDLSGNRAHFMKEGIVAGNNILVEKFLSIIKQAAK